MKRTITWIRHGESEWNAAGRWQGHTDIGLSQLGREQAQTLRARLETSIFERVYSSDLSRAYDTARLALPDSEIFQDRRLREINFGIYEGRTREDLDQASLAQVKRWWMDPYTEKLEKGESMTCLNTRVQDFIEHLPGECNICIFTHGGVIRNAVWQVVGPPKNGRWSVLVDNVSITKIEYSSLRDLIICANDCAHLQG